jgi:hypothetical protein
MAPEREIETVEEAIIDLQDRSKSLSNVLKLVGKFVGKVISEANVGVCWPKEQYKNFKSKKQKRRYSPTWWRKKEKMETETFYPDNPTLFKQFQKILQNSWGLPTPSYTAILSDIPIKHDRSRSYLENDMRLPLRLLQGKAGCGCRAANGLDFRLLGRRGCKGPTERKRAWWINRWTEPSHTCVCWVPRAVQYVLCIYYLWLSRTDRLLDQSYSWPVPRLK